MDPRWKEINNALQGRGFVSVQSPFEGGSSSSRFRVLPNDAWYFGILQTKRGPASVYLSLSDLEFTRPPSVWLNERPHWLAGWRPHLIPVDGKSQEWLCYSDHVSFQLLSHNPARALLRVLEDATVTLDRIADPTTVVADSMREISILWHGSGDLIYCDADPCQQLRQYPVGSAKQDGMTVYLVSERPAELAKKVGVKEPVMSGEYAAIYPEPARPLHITPVGPPRNMAELHQWLSETSPETYEAWKAMLKSPKLYERSTYFHFFQTNGELIGFFMQPDQRLSAVRGARNIRAFIDRQIYKRPARITRLSALRVDNTYLVRRNLPAETPDLRGCNILLIGCGTIGGYLGPALVQLGAGIDHEHNAGKLTLCDEQILTQQNIGRHALGMNWLGKNKAVAVASEIETRRHGVHVTPIDEDVFSISDQFIQFDLIINATGYEPIGRRLSKLLRQRDWFSGTNCLLHTWIEGRGGVTRSLLEDGPKVACFDCMWTYSGHLEPKPRYEPYGTPDWYARAGDGYATMTPFSVSASHAATALAIDAILAWRGGRPTPRFRSRSAEGRDIRPNVSVDLAPSKNCPLCSTSF